MLIVLASASPRRVQLLSAAGIACEVRPMDVDERWLPGEAAEDYVQRVADLKAAAAARLHPDAIVIGADTAVVVDEDILGKPTDRADAARMLRRLSGRSHRVLTGVALRGASSPLTFVESTTVWMSPLTEADIAWYVATEEPMDKAGAYAVQGYASRFVTRLDGSYSNVVGLPIARVWQSLADRAPAVVVAPQGRRDVLAV